MIGEHLEVKNGNERGTYKETQPAAMAAGPTQPRMQASRLGAAAGAETEALALAEDCALMAKTAMEKNAMMFEVNILVCVELAGVRYRKRVEHTIIYI